MGTKALEEAISDGVINFDRRMLVTDLLQEYRLSYSEVNEALKTYIEENERKGTKFEKRFIVSGEEQEDNEIYTIVKGETKLQEWLKKLKNAESALYSVEVAEGAKSAADIFKPMSWCPGLRGNIATRPPLQWGTTTTTNGDKNDKKPIVEPKKTKGFDFGAKKPKPEASSGTSKSSIDQKKEVKKASPEIKKPSTPKKQTTPDEQKPTTTKTNQKGIASFFGPNAATAKSEPKKASRVIKPPTPKKMQDFFKKSTAKVTKEESPANKSMQLFANDEDDVDEDEDGDEAGETKDKVRNVVDVDTSDDEAQLEALRRQCRENDDEVADTSICSGSKRRRIFDSDDEEPEGKHDKKEEDEAEDKDDNEERSEGGQSETFLDDDGFVITIKSKKPASTKKPAKPATPEKTSPKQEASKKPTKAPPKQTAKTKQGNIMNFFSKK